MRKLAIAFTLLAIVFAKSSFAADGVVSPEVLKSFQQKFSNAKDADWSITQELYKVQFNLNGQAVTAFYNQDGSLAAITRNLNSLQLPVTLQSIVKNDYKEFWISNLFEVSNDEGVQYYITLEDADTKLVLKSTGTMWSQYQRNRKG